MQYIKPPFPFPDRWNAVRMNPTVQQYWNLPFHHCPQSLAIRMPCDLRFSYVDNQPPNDAQMPEHLQNEQLGTEIEEESEEYMVDFKLELNEAWASRLLATARRLKLVSVPKKPSKAKKAHKKKMRAKSKEKKKLRLQEGKNIQSSSQHDFVDSDNSSEDE